MFIVLQSKKINSLGKSITRVYTFYIQRILEI